MTRSTAGAEKDAFNKLDVDRFKDETLKMRNYTFFQKENIFLAESKSKFIDFCVTLKFTLKRS